MLSLMKSNDLQAPRPAAQRWKGNCPHIVRYAVDDDGFAQLPEGLGASSLVIESVMGLPCLLPFAARTDRFSITAIQWRNSPVLESDAQPSLEIDQVSSICEDSRCEAMALTRTWFL